jgi:hypothetical protein
MLTALVGAIAMATMLLVGTHAAFATHAEVSLTGSNFEIDKDANLKLDDEAPSIDWATVNEVRKTDKPTGTSDDSFGQGTKEDTAVPTVVNGSIPPNKSDLKTFGVYQEGGSDGFLNLFWSRVQDPTGTTNMDFEFNQSKTLSSNGVTPVRTTGDLLITYDLSNGGTNPTISMRTWTGTAWGSATPLGNKATGSINTSAIPAAESDGLGALSARTFGEAQINLTSILPQDTCTSFGSAYLKSRSSDTFSSAVKDFVAPVAVNISNCGSVEITKTDDASKALAGAVFTLYNDKAPVGGTRGSEDTITNPLLNCTTVAAGTCSIPNVPKGAYWVVETTTPEGYTTAADQQAQVTSNTAVKLTFVNVLKLVQSELTTGPTLTPQDTAEIKWDDAKPPTGTVTFSLYNTADCSNNAVFNQTLDAAASVKTTNSTFEITAANAGKYYWLVEYKPATDDKIHQPVTSACGEENFTADPITNATDRSDDV